MVSKTDTWMPLFIGDYKKDTGHLCAAEHGAYLLLIMHHWVTQAPLPDNDRQLSRIAAMDLSEWIAVRPIIQPFFQCDNDGWTHKRVVEELAGAAKRSQAAREKAERRWGVSAGADATASDQHSHSIDTVEPQHKPRTCSSPSSGSSNHKTPSHPTDVRSPSADPRGSRLAADWHLPGEWRQWAIDQGIPPPLIDREAVRFPDYWHGAAGAKGRKADWFATWRNWMRDKIDGKFRTTISGAKPSLAEQLAELDRLGAGGSGPLESFGDPAGGIIIDQPGASH